MARVRKVHVAPVLPGNWKEAVRSHEANLLFSYSAACGAESKRSQRRGTDLTIGQFIWVPRRYQCDRCVTSTHRLLLHRTDPEVLPWSWIAPGVISATEEMETTVETLVLAVYQIGQTEHEHRCWHDAGRSYCHQCRTFSYVLGWWDGLQPVSLQLNKDVLDVIEQWTKHHKKLRARRAARERATKRKAKLEAVRNARSMMVYEPAESGLVTFARFLGRALGKFFRS